MKNWKLLLVLFFAMASSIAGRAQDIKVLTSTAAANALEATPNTPDANPADLRIQSKAGNSKIAFIKFDISSIAGDVESASLRIYGSQHEDEVNDVSQGTAQRSIVTPYRVMLMPVENTSWDASFTWSQIGGENDDVLPRNPYRLSEVNIIDFNKPHANGKDSKYQQFTGPIIADYLNAKKAEGKTEVAFAMIALDSVDVHGTWAGGTWRNPELRITEGIAPTKLPAADVAELFEAAPAQLGNVDVSDLRVQSSSAGASIISTLKFDLSQVTGSVSAAALQVYGAQHNDEAGLNAGQRAPEYFIEVYETNDATWQSSSLSYGTYPGHAGQAVAIFDMFNANNGTVLNRMRGYQSHIIAHKHLTQLVNQYIEDGKTEISFSFVATEVNDNFDAWFGGTWQAPALYLEHGAAPQSVPASVAVQVNSTQPNTPNPDGDANDLDIQTKSDGSVAKSYVKFDVTGLSSEEIKYVTLNPYGAQKGTPKTGPYSDNRFLVDVLGVESDASLAMIDGNLTYNLAQTFTLTNDGSGTNVVLARTNIYQADQPHRILQYPEFSQQALTEFVKRKISEGATEVAFEFVATDTIDDGEGAWLASLWRAPELTFYTNPVPPNQIPDEVEVAETLNPIDDTWVGEADEFANHDGEADMNITMITGDQREAYLKFDLSNAVPADYVALTVRGAQQDDTTWTAISDFYVELSGGSDNSWDDAGMVWVNKVDTDSDALGTLNLTETSSAWFDIASQALTDYVNAQIDSGATAVTLVLRGRDETPGSRAWISSSDWQAPELRFFYEASPDVEAPTFDPFPGLYPVPGVTISLSSATAGASIYYTTDGKVPTESSTLYTAPFDLTGVDGDNFTVRAVAVNNGVRSAVSNAQYSLGSQQPYTGTAFTIPGQVNAWQFDLGGQGISYFEGDLGSLGDCGGNTALSDERTDNAPVDGCCTNGQCEIGWASTGEWFEYTVNVNAQACFSPSLIYNKAGDDFPAALKIETVDNAGQILRTLVEPTAFTANSTDWGTLSFDNTPLSLDTAFVLDAGLHTIRVTFVENNWTFGGLIFDLSQDCVTSLEDSEEIISVIYPNPIKDGTSLKLNFEYQQQEKAKVVLRDLNGRMINVQEVNVSSGLNAIDVMIDESISNGFYLLELQTEKGRFTHRLVIQR